MQAKDSHTSDASAQPVGSGHPVARIREQFSRAAAAVTHLYRSPDRRRFAQAANAVTNLYREAEADALRANHRGARDSLSTCLDWVARQGAYVDGAHLVYLLKQQITMHSQHIDQSSSGYSESSDEEDESPCARMDPLRRDTVSVAEPEDPIINFQNDTSRSFSTDHNRKRRAGDDMFEEVGLLRYPHLWPVKHIRRTYDEQSMDGPQ